MQIVHLNPDANIGYFKLVDFGAFVFRSKKEPKNCVILIYFFVSG